MVYSGYDIFTKVHDPGDTSSLDSARDTSSQLKTIHENIVRHLTESQAKLNAFWKGKAADTGTAGLTPLIQSSQIVAENMDRAHRSMQEQSDAFRYVKQNARQVAKDRPDDQKLSDYVSIGASDDEKAAAQFDSDTKFNVELYEPYYQSTQPRKTTLAPDYPAAHDPNVSATGITPDPSTPGTATGRIGSGIGHHSSGGGSSHNYGGGYSSGPSTYSAPPGAAGMQAPPPPGHGGVVTPPVSPPNDSTRAAWADPTPPPSTPPTWQPPSSSPGGGNPGTGGLNGGFGPVSGFGGGFGPTAGGSGSGGFGPGGSGSGGAGSGGAGPRGVGGGTGAGALGESAGAARPGAGGAGAAGAKGQPGMGGMGGGGKGGKGPEDEEHQRKILLAEEDPDSIFGGYDGNRPTPPVIGA
ncbi:hypothetical protein ACWEHA_03990 [Amycolatopsis nivea]